MLSPCRPPQPGTAARLAKNPAKPSADATMPSIEMVNTRSASTVLRNRICAYPSRKMRATVHPRRSCRVLFKCAKPCRRETCFPAKGCQPKHKMNPSLSSWRFVGCMVGRTQRSHMPKMGIQLRLHHRIAAPAQHPYCAEFRIAGGLTRGALHRAGPASHGVNAQNGHVQNGHTDLLRLALMADHVGYQNKGKTMFLAHRAVPSLI